MVENPSLVLVSFGRAWKTNQTVDKEMDTSSPLTTLRSDLLKMAQCYRYRWKAAHVTNGPMHKVVCFMRA
eukprot:scaffold178337_cov39-Prasinocladus_malaysianus.AAC.2